MKANAPRRKVFNDAIDLLTDEMPVVVAENGIQMKIVTYFDTKCTPLRPFV